MKIKQKITALLLIVTGVSLLASVQAPMTASALDCSVLPKDICSSADNGTLTQSGIWKILLLVLNIMVAGVGIVAVGALGFAGFLYASAADDQNKIKQAKDMIRNTVIGIVAFGLMYVALNFLIPGGIF